MAAVLANGVRQLGLQVAPADPCGVETQKVRTGIPMRTAPADSLVGNAKRFARVTCAQRSVYQHLSLKLMRVAPLGRVAECP